MARRVAVIGMGPAGSRLFQAMEGDPSHFKVVAVYNRTRANIPDTVPEGLIIGGSGLPSEDGEVPVEKLDEILSRKPELVVESTRQNVDIAYLLGQTDVMVLTPTRLVGEKTYLAVEEASVNHSLYLVQGALVQLPIIQQMVNAATLTQLEVVMRKHPTSWKFYLEGEPLPFPEGEYYSPGIETLAREFPTNTNTITTAWLAARKVLSPEHIKAAIVADPKLEEGNAYHVVEVTLWGPKKDDGRQYRVGPIPQWNPAVPGAVTGDQTLTSFVQSLYRAQGKGPGIHLVTNL